MGTRTSEISRHGARSGRVQATALLLAAGLLAAIGSGARHAAAQRTGPTLRGTGAGGPAKGGDRVHRTAVAQNTANLSSGVGDGAAAVIVDPYGSFGFESSGGPLLYDPIGPETPASTVFNSRVWFSGANQAGIGGAGTWLDTASLGEVQFTASNPAAALSEWTLTGLRFQLEQRMLQPTSSGTIFRQTYRIINTTGAPVSFDLIRFLDPDIHFDQSFIESGGASLSGQQVYGFERTPPGFSTVFVGTDLDGRADLGFQVEEFPEPDVAAQGRAALKSTIARNGTNADVNGDRIVDVPQDVALAIGQTFSVEPGAFVTLVTNTVLGQGVPEEVLNSPNNLSAAALSDSEIGLRWIDNSPDESGFQIERSVDRGPFSILATVPPDTGTFVDRNLPEGTTFTYRVRAIRPGGPSPSSNEASATTRLRAPSGLAAVVISQTAIGLAWSDNSARETGYAVERSAPGVPFARVAELPADSTTFTEGTLTAGTTYTYRVQALGPGIDSAYSNTETATTFPDPPAAPSNLTVTPLSNTSVSLLWVDNSTNEEGFIIERRTGTGAFGRIDRVNEGVTSYADTGLTPGTSYSYRVRAFNAGGESAASNEAGGATQSDPPIAPTNLRLFGFCKTQLYLRWRDNSFDETGFEIERLNSAGQFTRIAAVDPNTTEYIDRNLSPDTEFTYRVRAVGPGGPSDYSNQDTGRTLRQVPAGALSVTPSSVTFKENGTVQTKTVTLKNTGRQQLSAIVGSLDSPFSILTGGGALILKPGQSARVKIQYAPSTETSSVLTALLEIHSTDRDGRKTTVKVRRKSGGK